jgi:hypothetical protein
MPQISSLLLNSWWSISASNRQRKGDERYSSRLCFERHATSKMRVLLSLNTKRFRGEALLNCRNCQWVEM